MPPKALGLGAHVADLARIPDAKARTELAGEALRLSEDDRDYSRDELRRKMRKTFMLDLASAPFDITDEKLFAKAGSCSTCPKRSGQQRELFDEVADKHDLCLDRGCYRTKVDAWWARETKSARESGTRILTKAEIKQAIHYGHLTYNAPFVATDTELNRMIDTSSKRTLATALKKDPPTRCLARTDDGQVFELYDRKEVAKKLKAVGLINKATATRTAAGSRSISPSEKARETRERRERKIYNMTTERAISAVVKKAEKPLASNSRLLEPLAMLLCSGRAATEVAKARALGKREDLEKEIRKLEKAKGAGPKLRGIVFELALRDAIASGYGRLTADVKAALKAWRVDVNKIEKTVKAELAAKDKAKKAKARKKTGAAKKKAATKKKAPATMWKAAKAKARKK